MLSFLFPITRAQTTYDISTPIPSSNLVQFSDINTYISAIFSFGVYLGFGLAFTIIVYGGIRYAASFSSEKDLTNAKDWIWAAVIGLLILITSTLLLNSINPSLLSTNPLSGARDIGSPNAPPLGDAGSGNVNDGQLCSDNTQCSSRYCDLTRPETVDVNGVGQTRGRCAHIPLGGQCTINAQCATNYCDANPGPLGTCTAGDTSGNKNLPANAACTNDVQCSSGMCDAMSVGATKTCLVGKNLPSGASCFVNRQCKSNGCMSGWFGYYCE